MSHHCAPRARAERTHRLRKRIALACAQPEQRTRLDVERLSGQRQRALRIEFVKNRHGGVLEASLRIGHSRPRL